MSRNSGLLIFKKCAYSSSVYFLSRSKVPLLQNYLAMTGCLNGQIAGKEVSKVIWVTKVAMTPVLPFHQAAGFSGFEINLFTDSSVSSMSMDYLFYSSQGRYMCQNFSVSYAY